MISSNVNMTENQMIDAYAELIDACRMANVYFNIHIKMAKYPSSNDIFVLEFIKLGTDKKIEVLKSIKDPLLKELPLYKVKNFLIDELWRRKENNFYNYIGDIYNLLNE